MVARGPARLIEDILDPNRNVDPLFRQTTIETKDGEILLGANLRDQGDAILFADPAGKEHTVPKARIKKQTASALSLMPPIYETAIPAARTCTTCSGICSTSRRLPKPGCHSERSAAESKNPGRSETAEDEDGAIPDTSVFDGIPRLRCATLHFAQNDTLLEGQTPSSH